MPYQLGWVIPQNKWFVRCVNQACVYMAPFLRPYRRSVAAWIGCECRTVRFIKLQE